MGKLDLRVVERFADLFSGLDTAHGIGAGGWVREAPTLQHYQDHLEGRGSGLGIGPLRTDGTVTFAAIDLDEPDFETAETLASLLPGTSFIERSRSGNAHIWTHFSGPVDAWIPQGIMREACAAVNKRQIEVFPKQYRLREDMLGNYINLPYHGNDRPVLNLPVPIEEQGKSPESVLTLERFLDRAANSLNDPKAWEKRAVWLGIPTPKEREASGFSEFGTQKYLHQCAEHVLANREDNPVVEGHRAVVYFALCKQFANCSQYSRDESLALLGLINEASPDPIHESEMAKMYDNAVRGRFTSTSCDDPLFQPYADPNCPIAHGSR